MIQAIINNKRAGIEMSGWLRLKTITWIIPVKAQNEIAPFAIEIDRIRGRKFVLVYRSFNHQ